MTEPFDTIAAIRKRPGMYVGDVHDGSGVLNVLWEVVRNAVGSPRTWPLCRWPSWRCD